MSEQMKALVWLMWCVLLAILLGISYARAELCLAEPDSAIEKKGGYRWQWRTVDGRKCWYYSNRILPREDLVWSYKSEDFDSDVKVLGRKFYDTLEESGILKVPTR